MKNVSSISYDDVRNILVKERGIEIGEKAYRSIIMSLKEEANYKEQVIDIFQRDLAFFCALTGENKNNMLYPIAYEMFRSLDQIVGEEMFITTGKPELPMDRVEILDEVEAYMETNNIPEDEFERAEAEVKAENLNEDLKVKVEEYVQQLKM